MKPHLTFITITSLRRSISLRTRRALCSIAALTILSAALVGCNGSANIGISVTPTTTQQIDPGQSVAMQATVTGDFGNKGITWTVNNVGQLSGASLLPTATGSGQIIATNTYYAPSSVTTATNVTVVAASVADPSKTATVNITINPALAVVNPSKVIALANGTVNAAYSSSTFAVTGGSGSLRYVVTYQTLPPGLTINAATGLITGTPTTIGSYYFNVTAYDSTGANVTQSFTIAVLTDLSITTTSPLPTGSINRAYSQQIVAANGSGSGYSYVLTNGALPPGLNLSKAGLVSGTATQTGTYSFSITVTDSAGNTATKAFTLLINQGPLAITSANTASGEVALPFSFPVQIFGGSTPYTASLASGSNALPTGLTLNASSGLISGTPTATGTTTVTFQVSDAAGAMVTQTVTITINAARTNANNSQFNGQYAFLLTGSDAVGNPLTWVGKITADGAGNIGSGTVDINGTALAASQTQTLSAATYALGSGNRGKLTLTTAAGSSAFVIVLNKAVNGVAPIGYMTETDATGQSLTGRIALEDTTAFLPTSLINGYAFGLAGFQTTATSHAGVVGQVTLTGTGVVSSGEIVSSATGAAQVTVTSGVYTVAPTGRGTLTLILSNGTSLSMVFYVVSAKQLFVASLGTANGASASALLAGQVAAQSTPLYTAASLKGAGVSETTRLLAVTSGTSTTYAEDVRVGVFTFDGASIASFSGDENAGGASSQPTFSGKYTVASNGRVVTYLGTGFGGSIDGGNTPTVLYLTGANQGFLLDLLPGFGTGMLEAQTVSTTTTATFNGSYVYGTTNALVKASTNEVAALNSTGTGTLTATEDQNTNGTVVPDKAITGTYTAVSNGRVAVTASDGTLPVLYFVSPTRALGVDLSTAVPVVIELNQ